MDRKKTRNNRSAAARGASGASSVRRRRKKRRRRKYIVSGIIMVILFFVFLISGFVAVRTLLRYRSEDKYFERLAERVAKISTENREIGESGETKDSFLDALKTLHEENGDLYGWIKIDGTRIDYPVMYTPNDPEYYIDHNFDGETSSSGAPFIGEGFSEGGLHTIIYGHNMKNGTMFADLLDYSRSEFYKEHQTIEYYTLSGKGEYEIISAFYSRVYYQEETDVFRYYNYTDLSDEETFNEYISRAESSSMFDTGVTAEYGDEILTLSTCSYNTENGRFVVVAKRINE